MDVVLDDWLKQVTKVSRMDRADQEKITKAGAKVFAGKLRDESERLHPTTKGSGGKYGHLAENVSFSGGNVDGEHDGTSSVGFAQKAFVARMLNDGTKFIQGDHFIDNARADAMDEVMAAESGEYQKVLKKIEGGHH